MRKFLGLYLCFVAFVWACQGREKSATPESNFQGDSVAEKPPVPEPVPEPKVETSDETLKDPPKVSMAKLVKLECKGISTRETPELGLKVGCRLNDADGVKLAGDAIKIDSSKFRFNPQFLPPGLLSAKEIPAAGGEWDVVYDFSGVDPKLMLSAAIQGEYSYERINEDGVFEKINYTLTKDTVGLNIADVCTGARVQDVCYFQTIKSCSEECSSRGGVPNSLYVDRLSANQALCRSVITAVTGRTTFSFGGVGEGSAFGCMTVKQQGMTYFFSGTSRIDVNFEPQNSVSQESKIMCSCVAKP